MSNNMQVYKVFYACMSKPLLVYRIMGLLPIEGLWNSNGNKTRFIVTSLYTVYFGTVMFLQVINLLIILYFLLIKEKPIGIEPLELINTSTSIMVYISLLHLCKNWTPSLNKIEYIETLLPPLRSRKILVLRIKWCIYITALICLADMLFYNLYIILIVNHCFLLEDDSGWYFKSYFLATDSWVYRYIIPFNYATGFISQALKIQGFLMCQFSDILIVVITAYLTARVRNFYGQLIQKVKSRAGNISWCELQAQFTRLTTLVATIDDLISPFIFTSFLSHLLFICKQLYDMIKQRRNSHLFQTTECILNLSNHPVTTAAYSVPFAWLLLRTSVVSLSGAHLHTVGRASLNALHFVPTSMYNNEMQRLMDQVYHSKIGLSGLKLFYVTRGTVLSMVSTILTYELLLQQVSL